MKSIAATALVAMCLLAQPAKSLCDDAAAGGVKVGEELVLMADGPGQTMRSYPAVAFGKDIFPVAWQEGWQGKEGSSRIFLARVGLDGKILDPKGIEIAARMVATLKKESICDGVHIMAISREEVVPDILAMAGL